MVSDGVVTVPVAEMVVVPVAPTASVFAEKLVVDAFWILNWLGMESVMSPVEAEAVI